MNYMDLSDAYSCESIPNKAVKTSCSSKEDILLINQLNSMVSVDTIDELQLNYTQSVIQDNSLKTPFCQLDYVQMVQELVEREGQGVSSEFKENLVTLV